MGNDDSQDSRSPRAAETESISQWIAMYRFFQRVIVEPMVQVDADSRRYLALPAARGVDWKTIGVLVTAAVSLTLQNYFGNADGFARIAHGLAKIGFEDLSASSLAWLRDQDSGALNRLACWALGSFITYTALPLVVIRFGFRERIGDYGVKLHGAFTDGWIYGVMFAVMVPLILLVSQSQSFQDTYPFYTPPRGEPLWPNFWRWELFYAVQFLGLEFFFRGFLLHGTKHRFGCYSIFVMMVPYCMIHFAKPLPETCGAIMAGIALGFMSLKTRSIWLGAAIHITVALSMDFASLWRQKFFE